MRALVFDHFGPPSVLALQNVPTPTATLSAPMNRWGNRVARVASCSVSAHNRF